jgi:hypothetical protein
MSKLQISFEKGNNDVDQETNLDAGFMKASKGVFYFPDGRRKFQKIPGNVLAGALPSGASDSNTNGIEFAKFKTTGDYVFAATQNKLSYALISGSTIGAWTDVEDKQAVPVDFPFTGSAPKAIVDGRNRYIFWSGNSGERPLVINEDGAARFLGMRPPSTLAYPTPGDATSALLTNPASQAIPDSESTPGTLTWSTRTIEGFTDPTLSFDQNDATWAYYETKDDTKIGATQLEFTDGGSTSGHVLYVDLAGIFYASVVRPRSLPSKVEQMLDGYWEPEDNTAGNGLIRILVSEDNGTSYVQKWSGTTYNTRNGIRVSIPLTDSTLWTDVIVQVTFEYTSTGTYKAGVNLIEVFAQDNTTGGSAIIDQGVYYYSHTEIYRETLASGLTYTVESSPSTPIPVTVSTDTVYGIQLVIPSAVNGLTDGVKHDVENGRAVSYGLYRSTKTGTWPSLGKIDEPAAGTTTYVDMFAVPGESLAPVLINTVSTGLKTMHANNPPPAFLDATLFKGSVVGIDAETPTDMVWSMPGYPEFYPEDQRQRLLPSNRNDEIVGITALGEDSIIAFMNTRVWRVRELQFVGSANYDPSRVELDIISPNHGLAAGPNGYALFELQNGRAMCAWISQNGIWMTDGSLVQERGMGAVKLSTFFNWDKNVDKTSLSTARLEYDPKFQTIWFDYTDRNSVAQVTTFHVSPHFWVASGQDQLVPAWLGPHGTSFDSVGRTNGTVGGVWKHFVASEGNLYIQGEGTDASDSDILSVVESGWMYPAASQGEFHLFLGSLLHSKWGRSEQCSLEIRTRRDESGSTQTLQWDDLSLADAGASNFWVDRAGQSLKIIWRHDGKTASEGAAKSVSLFEFDATGVGDLEED